MAGAVRILKKETLDGKEEMRVSHTVEKESNEFGEVDHAFCFADRVDAVERLVSSLDAFTKESLLEFDVTVGKLDAGISELRDLIPKGTSTTIDELQGEVYRIEDEFGNIESRLQKWVSDEVETRVLRSDLSRSAPPSLSSAPGDQVLNPNLVHLLPQLAPSATMELTTLNQGTHLVDTLRLRYLGQLYKMATTERVLHVHKSVAACQSTRHSNLTTAASSEAWRRIIFDWDLSSNMINPELHNVIPRSLVI
jgi:hypothetical protein